MRLRCIVAVLFTALFAVAQTKGPIEPKEPAPRRGPTIPRDYPDPPKAEPASTGVWREVITDEDGRVIRARGNEVTGHARTATASPELDAIEIAREVAWEFSSELPDYTCEQHTVRFEAKSRPLKWKKLDRVFADVVYTQRREYYVNYKINNKPLKKGTPFDSGTWSSGEYGTILLDVMAHNTAAKFKFVKPTEFDTRKTLLYEYTVDQPNSHWRVEFEGQQLRPAYKGQVWVDAENHRTLRVEMQARQLPSTYPMNVVEMTVDYGMVRIAERDIVVPVRAENLACIRDSLTCTRNETEFRNYKKFTTNSNVSTAESSIKFEGEDEGKAGKGEKKSEKKKK